MFICIINDFAQFYRVYIPCLLKCIRFLLNFSHDHEYNFARNENVAHFSATQRNENNKSEI